MYSSYIHGNVDTLLQSLPRDSGDYGQKGVVPNIMNKNGNRWKKLVYEYDLISGKVNKVMYQPRFSDQWTHRYYYDAENRLTEVETSTDGYTWEREAKYEYYLHGPLARTILGQQQVQGIDYAYTLQGWLKGVNSTGATIPHDIGGDAKAGGINQYIARDALGFNLNYFNGDYKTINPGVNPFPSYRLAGGSLPDSVYRPLYNGNISSMATHIRKFDELGHVPIFYNYRYDQLNRLVKQDAFFFSFNASTNSYGSNWAPDVTFHEDMSYDPNGNIQHYNRYAIGPDSKMDDLAYKYYPGTNKLRQVNDQISAAKYGNNSWDLIYDLDDQADTSNYVYDEIGNLIQDKQENVTSIKWNVYGKITEVNRTATAGNAYTKIAYSYDAQGNRIGKVANRNNGAKEFTWYVRDAQGNLMSTYVATGQDTVPDIRLQNLFLKQDDVYIYGSSRLGMLARGINAVDNGNSTGPWINPYYNGDNYNRGYRQYELTNHLGNVLTVISDRNKGVSSGGSLTLPNGATIPAVDYYDPDMLAANDYYPFGMLSRTMGTPDKYRFGFNGKETDNEVKGRQNQQDYGMRIYDPRVGRFLSVDPLTKQYPWLSPYAFGENSPIANIDLDGLETQYTADGRLLMGPVYVDPLGPKVYGLSSSKPVNFFTYVADHSKETVAKKPAAQPSVIKKDATAVAVNITIQKFDAAMSLQLWREGKGELTSQAISGIPNGKKSGDIKGPDPRRGLTDFEYGMATSPATIATTATLCPECYVLYGGAQIHSGIQTGNYWEVGAGVFDMIGGIGGAYARSFAPISNEISIFEPSINEVHVFMGEINKKGKAVGFHSPQFNNFAARITSIIDAPNAQGVFRANIEVFNTNTGTWSSKVSTMFPQSWNKQKVLQEIQGAYKNMDMLNGNKWGGVSPSGIRIEGYLDTQGAINTAYPIYQ